MRRSVFLLLALSLPLALGWIGLPLVGDVPFDKRLYVCLVEQAFAAVFFWTVAPEYSIPRALPLVSLGAFAGWLAMASVAALASLCCSASMSAGQVAKVVTRHGEWISHVLFGLALWGYLRRRPQRARTVTSLVLAGFGTLCVLLVGSAVLGIGPPLEVWVLEIPILSHVRSLGRYATVTMAVCVYPLLCLLLRAPEQMRSGGTFPGGAPGRQEGWKRGGLIFAALVLCWMVTAWTGGRGALLSGGAVLATVLWFLVPRERRSFALFFGGAAVLGIGLSLLLPTIDPMVGIANAVERTARVSSADQLLSRRLTLWQETLNRLQGHLWLGVGPGFALPVSDPLLLAGEEGKTFDQPHNLFLQTLGAWGIFGAVLFWAFWGLMVKRAVALIRHETDAQRRAARVTGLALVATLTAHGVTGGTYYHAPALMMLAAGFALALLPPVGNGAALPRDTSARTWSPPLRLAGGILRWTSTALGLSFLLTLVALHLTR